MTTQLAQTATRVLRASSYQDLFGDARTTDHLKKRYRGFAKVLHPDLYAGVPEKRLANEAFTRLIELHRLAEQALNPGVADDSILSIATRWGQHGFDKLMGGGDLCDLYEASSVRKGSAQLATIAKVARQSGDKDLLQAEATAIKKLRGAGSDPRRHPFIPELVDSFAYGERGKPTRQVNVLVRLEGFYNLEQVRRAFPAGLPVLDMAWIWRRMLLVLGYAHRQGLVHGAVLPSHVMILPEQHGLVMVDWCYSVQQTDGAFPPIQAIVKSYRDWYPEEVLAKQLPSAATDIAMAARCMIWLMGGNPVTGSFSGGTVPTPFRAFFKGCLSPRQVARPSDAWELLQEFDELLERLGGPYYPRRFRPFSMPTGME